MKLECKHMPTAFLANKSMKFTALQNKNHNLNVISAHDIKIPFVQKYRQFVQNFTR